MFFVLLLFIKSPSTDPNVLWFCFNFSKRRNIFRQNFFKIGNSGPNIACDRICNQLSYIPPIAICLTARKANGHRILRPWTNARCEFLKRPKPLMTYIMGAIHSTKLSGNFGPKLNGSVRSNRKSFEKRVHLLRWSSFPGRTGWNFGWMDRAHVHMITVGNIRSDWLTCSP